MNRRELLIALLLAALACGAWLLLRGPREPVYQGHPRSYWLEHCCKAPVLWSPPAWKPGLEPEVLYLIRRSSSSGWIPALEPQAAEAIRYFGTNAIPTLLGMVGAHDAPLKFQLMTALCRKQRLINAHFTALCFPGGGVTLVPLEKRRWFEVRFTPAWGHNFEASLAFEALGPAASNAVPRLIEICDANISAPSRAAAAKALGAIGPAARAAVPALLRAVADTNYVPRGASVGALGAIHAEPQLAVPVLVKALRDSDLNDTQIADAMGEYGPDAAAAVPLLQKMLLHTNTEVRLTATCALKRIDPTTQVPGP